VTGTCPSLFCVFDEHTLHHNSTVSCILN